MSSRYWTVIHPRQDYSGKSASLRVGSDGDVTYVSIEEPDKDNTPRVYVHTVILSTPEEAEALIAAATVAKAYMLAKGNR